MIVLGIESSCDESAVALVELGLDLRPSILFEQLSSQVNLHALYGGVVPELAAREHLASLPILVDEAITFAKSKSKEIDLVAVTQGPGLKGCLLIGLEFAKGYCLGRGIPLIGVNHIEGHVYAAKLEHPELQAPFLALIVSGGHTEIVKVNSIGKYEILSRTIDDAAGEAFDKSANLLGFQYPGGAKLAALADTVSHSRFELPKVMRESTGFSFSGLKTAIALLIQRQKEALKDEKLRAELAFSIQESIVDALLYKLKKELDRHPEIVCLTVSGGVACNLRLREKIKSITKLPILFPNVLHCVDNAAMIALVGALQANKLSGSDMHSLTASLKTRSLEVRPRWPIEN